MRIAVTVVVKNSLHFLKKKLCQTIGSPSNIMILILNSLSGVLISFFFVWIHKVLDHGVINFSKYPKWNRNLDKYRGSNS